jgi:hypothetical protein
MRKQRIKTGCWPAGVADGDLKFFGQSAHLFGGGLATPNDGSAATGLADTARHEA